ITGATLDPETLTWRDMPNTPDILDNAVLTWTGSRLLAIGHTMLAGAGFAYDPASETWTALSETNAPPALESGSVVWTGSAVLMWGGKALVSDTVWTEGRIYQ